MKKIIRNSFWQLLIIYAVLITLISFKLLWKFTLHFEIFALILAVFGLFLIQKQKPKINKWFILIPIILILLIRIIPLLTNPIPLGYDSGIYKYAIEKSYENNLTDQWAQTAFPLGLFSLTNLFYATGFSTNQILIQIFIFLELLLGLTIYLTTKKFFNKEVAILSILIYSISIIQFKVFSYFYYKNIIALILLLTALYLLKSNKYFLFILTASFLGGVHRPTFLLFALIFIGYTAKNFRDFKNLKKNIISGLLIIALTIPFYIGHFRELILKNITPIITANIGAGTFLNLFDYQFSTLIYLPFALLGFFYLIKNKKFNLLFIWFIINASIVYFKLIFYNRFLIHMDILMIILAAAGLYVLLQSKKNLGIAITCLLVISAFYMISTQATNAKPLVDEEELNIIKQLQNTEDDSYVMATSSYYSPWVLGYSNRKTIAPGLFDYNKWDYEQWKTFWNTDNLTVTRQLLSEYEKPLYIFIGKYQRMNLEKFNNTCFNKILEKNETKIYKYVCENEIENL